MKAKVLSTIVVIAVFFSLMILGLMALRLELTGFLDYLYAFIARASIITCGLLGGIFTIRWFWRD